MARARDHVLEIAAEDLNANNFTSNKLRLCVLERRKRISIMRPTQISRESSESMVDYIIEFEHRYNRIHKLEMEPVDAALAFKLLNLDSVELTF